MSISEGYVEELVRMDRKAQETIEFASQEEIDCVVESIAWHAIQPDFARKLSECAVEESQMGAVESKYAKMN